VRVLDHGLDVSLREGDVPGGGDLLGHGERNPVRAGMVAGAGRYRWSSAAAHLTGTDPDALLNPGSGRLNTARKD
jgi:hypothetical protein